MIDTKEYNLNKAQEVGWVDEKSFIKLENYSTANSRKFGRGTKTSLRFSFLI
jgi:hypothetical protein